MIGPTTSANILEVFLLVMIVYQTKHLMGFYWFKIDVKFASIVDEEIKQKYKCKTEDKKNK